MRTASTVVRVYAGPLYISVVTLAGLLSALLGDGVWDAISWLLLGAPIGLILFYLGRSKANPASTNSS